MSDKPTSIYSRRKKSSLTKQSEEEQSQQQIPQQQQSIQPHQPQQQQQSHSSQFSFLKMNNIKFTRCDGSTDVNNWLEEIEFSKIICKWSDDDLKLIIPASLTGPAKTF